MIQRVEGDLQNTGEVKVRFLWLVPLTWLVYRVDKEEVQ